MDFGKILKQGKRKFNIKNRPSKWGKCEACDVRRMLYAYDGKKRDIWMLCEECLETLIKDEK